jgi:hypothetical protein
LSGTDQNDLYLACKGGCGADNHGNLDAGSFILEWGGVRWSVDPGNQSYPELEKHLGVGPLWDSSQDSARWSLLTKNNFGHSVLTVNDRLHCARGRVRIRNVDLENPRPRVCFDLTDLYDGLIIRASREFFLFPSDTVEIEDQWIPNERTRGVCWQMITCAEAHIHNDGFLLRQAGREMVIAVCEHSGGIPQPGIVPLSPPPLPYDKLIPGLKRLEICMRPDAGAVQPPARLRVRLSGVA